MSIDIYKKLPTDAGPVTHIRKDLQDLIVKNIVNAVNVDFLKDVPEHLQLREMLHGTDKITKYRATMDNGMFVLENGGLVPYQEGDKIRFIAPSNNEAISTIRINNVEYDLKRPNGEDIIGDEIGRYHEVLLEYTGEYFRIIPTSSAPLVPMNIYQGLTEITVSSPDELISFINNLSGKMVIDDITVTISSSEFNFSTVFNIENIHMINAKLTIASDDSTIFKTDSDIETVVDINSCDFIEFANITFERSGVIFTCTKGDVSLRNCVFNGMAEEYITFTNSNLVMNDVVFNYDPLNGKIITLIESDAELTNVTVNNNDEDKTVVSRSTFVYLTHSSKIYINYNVDVNDIYYGIIGFTNSFIYMNKDTVPEDGYSIKINNARYAMFAVRYSYLEIYNGIMTNCFVAAAASGGTIGKIDSCEFTDCGYSVSCFGNSVIYCGNTKFNSCYCMAYATKKSHVDMFSISDSTITQGLFLINNQSSLRAYGINFDFADGEDYILCSLKLNSGAEIVNVSEGTDAEYTSEVAEFSIMKASNTDLKSTNVTIGELHPEGIIFN